MLDIYLTKKVKRRVRVEDDGIFCSCSSTPGSSGVCGRDCHCGMLQSSCSSNCKCDSSCLNKPFHQRPVKKMNVVQWLLGAWIPNDPQNQFMGVHKKCCHCVAKSAEDTCEIQIYSVESAVDSEQPPAAPAVDDIVYYGRRMPSPSQFLISDTIIFVFCINCDGMTEKCGSGVVAEEDIMRGEFVIEYVGEVIDDKTCEERLWRMKRQGETNFYLCEINRDMVIDATYKGNKSRYINHSCSPNTEMQKWFVQFGADQDCHCGAAGCRRKLGVKPNNNKAKLFSSDAALKLVACQVAINSPKVKAVVSGKDDYKNGVRQAGCSRHVIDRTRIPHNCNGQVLIIIRPESTRLFGIIKRFNVDTKKHLIMFEDGVTELLDLTQVQWELCNL
ncbi:AWS-like protein [Artemisia annua]|uniref:AWS-like protein n=1 Tax=Artemisia annua TaxID=35608 RepID=A0A2U1MWY6_ARTAN|nr:AWS-like protein [Artemisia annua]